MRFRGQVNIVSVNQTAMESDVLKAIAKHGEISSVQLRHEVAIHDKLEFDSIIRRLLAAGLIRESQSEQGVLISTPAEQGFIRVIEYVLDGLRNDVDLLNLIAKTTSSRHYSSYSRPDEIEVIFGVDKVLSRMIEFSTSLRSTLDGMHCVSPTVEEIRHASAEERRMIERGIIARSLVPEEYRNVAARPKYRRLVRESLSIGLRIRTSSFVPIRLLIFDSSAAIITELRDGDEPYAIATTNPQLVSALSRVFEAAWEAGRPLTDVSGRDVPSGQRLRILELIAQGIPDKSICKRLAISERALAREVAALREMTDAPNRVTLAVEAVRRGWID